MMVPAQPKIFRIMHVDRLASVLRDDYFWCDAEIAERQTSGTNIGMSRIKKRRLEELRLTSHRQLFVGQCVPFYFCPRSIMLYLIHKANHQDLDYKGVQDPIIHLGANFYEAVKWADQEHLRWAFTLSNAGSYFFEDRCHVDQLHEIDWQAVNATNWQRCKEGKQAEFLMERRFPWHLIRYIGVKSQNIYGDVVRALQGASHKPKVEVRAEWYY